MAQNRSRKTGQEAEIEADVPANPRQHLADIDKRSAGGRRFAQIVEGILEEIGGTPRPAQVHLAREASALIVAGEVLQLRLTRGEDVDSAALATNCNAVARLFEALGIDTVRPPDDRPERIPSMRIFG
ncbi:MULTISPECIES: hypothetical protein [unclassified Mesorhizobium]|uniref:hypothetical protein n=1 Tax=unclassified Mesorhizobium TaxID=325217 RepID=UPI003338E337